MGPTNHSGGVLERYEVAPSMAPAYRERILLKLADLIEANLEELAVLETIDNGKPLSAAREIDLPDALRFARYPTARWVRSSRHVSAIG